MGSSTLGGAFLGYLLILAGLHPLVMIPSIIIPPGLCIYDMLNPHYAVELREVLTKACK